MSKKLKKKFLNDLEKLLRLRFLKSKDLEERRILNGLLDEVYTEMDYLD